MEYQYVYLLQATEAQYQKIMKFLDSAIKKDGLEAIQDVVDIYNVLVSGQKMPVYPQSEPVAQEQPTQVVSEPVQEEEKASVTLTG